MSSPDGSAEPLFSEVPKPSQVPVTVLSPMMATGPAMTPKQILAHHSPTQFEEFVYEWLLALREEGYVDVMQLGGAHDGGADVAAFLTAHRTDDRWHCYQCKHYGKALTPAIAYVEILKIIAVVADGKYRTLPERYVFVAPRIGASLTQLLAKPAELKETFLDWAAKGTDRLTAEYGADPLGAALELARETDFARFEAANLDRILEQHATTPYHVRRFGTRLPDREARQAPPPEHTPVETRYIQKLLDVYQEKWGCDPAAMGQVRAHSKAGPHLQHQREAFYCAEQLRVFARDSVPEGTFESLQKNVYDGVVNVTWRDFATGFDRLNAVQDAARDMPLGTNVLVHVVETIDRMGICHQLANDDRLTWVEEET
ncbi:ABC-three component system protein [Streptomyces sp. NPDC088817]|jgi:hypothetical protein|uniref:Restriction endonuclease n=1 Tax=Streptomyces griseorubiginosus TaxID=67304 RepID=A0AAI8KTW9_9ACTN|nr:MULTISPECIES: ABC-three component system protein [Streptomyces]AYC35866.1 hypothetical protein DWG14_00073 [Streptomyces griseorubiginosus]MBC3989401.1 restriction endonuclease [Streptomyces buecherae]